jgi:azurin
MSLALRADFVVPAVAAPVQWARDLVQKDIHLNEVKHFETARISRHEACSHVELCFDSVGQVGELL